MTSSCSSSFEGFKNAAEVEGSGRSEERSLLLLSSVPLPPLTPPTTLAKGMTSGWSPLLSSAESCEAPQAESTAQRAWSLAGGWARATEER